jgi:O-6-methylguanine DNA methyltransferase
MLGNFVAYPVPEAAPSVAKVPTPIGTFRLVYSDRTVHLVDLLERGTEQSPLPSSVRWERSRFPPESPPAQLLDYFRGRRRTFDVRLDPTTGTDFDRAVWTELARLPSGRTITYGELARRAGHSGAARAVGGAMRRNPIPIIVPCHRVVGEDGSLTGFGLGLWRKRWLLDHEGAWPLRSRTPDGPKDPRQRTIDGTVPKRAEPRVSRRSTTRRTAPA